MAEIKCCNCIEDGQIVEVDNKGKVFCTVCNKQIFF